MIVRLANRGFWRMVDGVQQKRDCHARWAARSLLSEEVRGCKRAIVTTVLRGANDRRLTGYLFDLDLATGKTLARRPIGVADDVLWGRRGGNRGGRGVFVAKGRIYAATASSVLVFDSRLKMLQQITNPMLAGLHEIFVENDGIWVTSTIHDIVLKMDFSGNTLDVWRGSESTVLQNFFGFAGRNIDLHLDFPGASYERQIERYIGEERLHVNTVQVYEGAVYVFSLSRKALIRIRPLPEQVIMRDGALDSPHNGMINRQGMIMVNDTRNQRLRFYDRGNGRCLQSIRTMLSRTGASTQFALPGWQRGLCHVEGDVYLVGTSPASVFEVDVATREIGRVYQLDDDVSHSVHGLCIADKPDEQPSNNPGLPERSGTRVRSGICFNGGSR